MDQRIVFLGGIFLPGQKEMIERNSIGNMQYAADSFQKGLLAGLSRLTNGAASLVNLPYVGAYPRSYRRAVFPAASDLTFGAVTVHGMRFLNLRFLKSFSRFLSAYRGLERASGAAPAVVIVYAAHLPFIAAAILRRALRHGTRVCLVLPDLPEFTGEGGLGYRTGKSIQKRLFYALAAWIDCFVVLTPFMAERLGLDRSRYVVVEGIFDAAGAVPAVIQAPDVSGRRTILYTGTLAARYGILSLLQAFAAIENPDTQLWICGDGDARQAVIDMAGRDDRVRYFGLLPREQVLALQAKASILVNPRLPSGEFTKYSFPSKTMEYLASGRPLLMHHLPGMPDEYALFIITPPTPDDAGFAKAMRSAVAMTDEELTAIGDAARNFVLTKKDPVSQCARILDLIRSGVTRKGLPGAA